MRIVLIMICLFPLVVNAQSHKNKPKVSNSRGTMFGSWGYNRSWYSKSSVNFVGPGYDFTLKGSKASDAPTKLGSDYFKPITLPQFNARLGYYIRNHYAIAITYDHYKYILNDQNQVLLSGTINPGVDTATNWSGTYTNEPVTIDHSKFQYGNSNGLNYLRLEFIRTDQLYRAGKNDQFVISSNLGIGFGSLFSSTSFLFGGKMDEKTNSLSGFALSAHAGLRFEFFRQFFIQSNFNAGYMNQRHVLTRTNEPNSFAKNQFAYSALDASVGFFLYIRPTNDCNSCPNW